MRVPGIESSCDEAGMAPHDTGRGLLVNALHTQGPGLAASNRLQHTITQGSGEPGCTELNHVTQSRRSLPTSHRAEAVRRLYLGIGSVVPYTVLLPLALVIGLWRYSDHATLIYWFIPDASLAVWQYLLVRRYRQKPPEPEEAVRWGRMLTWPMLAGGIAWGIAGYLFYQPDNLAVQLILLGFIIGIPAGSIFATSWWPAMQYAFAYPALGLTAIGLLIHNYHQHLGLALGLLVFMLILHQIMRQAHAAAMESIALRFDNQDLIEQLRQEKCSAEQANLAKSRFLAAASHDLRQPLHALTLFVAALEERNRQPETQPLIAHIQSSASALESLFQTLLDISRIDAGIVEATPCHFNTRDVVGRLLDEFRPQAEAAGLKLHARIDDLTAHSDPNLVARILRNLISNAIRYTPEGEIQISCQHRPAGIVITVCDTGIGIALEQQARVFEEFVQVGNPERDRSKGLGLGLAIVRRLAGLLGTTVTLDSAPGQGACFQFQLPLGEKASVTPDIAHDNLSLSLNGLVVGVIDDEASVRTGLRLLLEGWGCRVIDAESGPELVARSRQTNVLPQVLLADYRLRQGTTGPEAIQSVRAAFDNDLPAALITGDTAPEILNEARASGHILLHKPVKPAKLRVLLRNLTHTDSLRPET